MLVFTEKIIKRVRKMEVLNSCENAAKSDPLLCWHWIFSIDFFELIDIQLILLKDKFTSEEVRAIIVVTIYLLPF